MYFPEKHLFTKEQFNLLFNGLGSYAENKNKIGKEVDNPFEHKVYYLKHHDLNVVLRTMWGQGTMRQMRTGLPKEWVEELSFTIEEYLDWVKEK